MHSKVLPLSPCHPDPLPIYMLQAYILTGYPDRIPFSGSELNLPLALG